MAQYEKYILVALGRGEVVLVVSGSGGVVQCTPRDMLLTGGKHPPLSPRSVPPPPPISPPWVVRHLEWSVYTIAGGDGMGNVRGGDWGMCL